MPSAAPNLAYSGPGPADLDWSQWLEADLAASRLGVSASQVRRRCNEEWGPRGKAIHIKPRGGGRPKWHVHVSCDPRKLGAEQLALAPAKADGLEHFTATQRRQADQRAECVRRFRREKQLRQRPVKDWIGELVAELDAASPDISVSQSSLYRWHKDAGEPIDLLQLVDTRGGKKDAGGSPEAWRYFAEQFNDPREPSVKLVWERTRDWARQRGVNWCSLHSCRRQAAAGTRPNLDLETQVYHRRPAEWRSRWAAWHEQDPERYAVGECWVADHRPLDVFCLHEGKPIRPYVTTWQCWRSRRIVGWALSPNPNTDTILAALHMALVDPVNGGPPTWAILDNGKDFDSYALHGQTKLERKRNGKVDVTIDQPHFRGVFGRLGIEVVFSQPYGPQGKSREERSFATMAARFDKSLPHYTGRDTTRKPENLNDLKAKKGHLMPTLSRLRERLGAWIAGHNATTDHSIDDLVVDGERLSRDAMMARRATRRMVPDDLSELLMIHDRPQSVGRNGVGLTIDGQRIRFGQYAVELGPYKNTKKKVTVAYDPSGPLRQVLVRDAATDRFVCWAERNQLMGRAHGHAAEANKADFKKAAKSKRQYVKAMKLVREHREHEYLTTEELAADQAAERLSPPDQPRVEGALKFPREPDDAPSPESGGESMAMAAGAEHDAGDDGYGAGPGLLERSEPGVADDPDRPVLGSLGLLDDGDEHDDKDSTAASDDDGDDDDEDRDVRLNLLTGETPRPDAAGARRSILEDL